MDCFNRGKPPILIRFRASNTFILITICLAAFTDGFLYAVVVPVLPYSLKHESGVPEHDVQRWSSYLLTVFGGATLLMSPLAGWIADRTSSRRIPFLVGLVVQAGSTSLFLLSPKVAVLMIARALQGLSAAVVYSVGLAILVDTVGMSDIGRNAGYFLSSANLGVLISPLIGGLVYNKAGYYAVVVMMISLVGVDIALRLVMVEKSTAAYWVRENDAEITSHRSILRHNSTVNTVYGTMADNIAGPRTRDRKQMPAFIRLLTVPRALANVFAVLVSYILLAAFDAGLAVFLKDRFQWSSSSAGASFLAIALPSLLSPIAGSLSDKFGPRWITVAGFIVSVAGLLGIGRIERPTAWQLVGLYTCLVLIGSGIAFVLPCVADDLTTIASNMTADNHGAGDGRGAYAQAYALFNCGIAGGTVLGPLLMSTVSRFGWQPVTLGLATLPALACVPIALFYESSGADENSME
ncbi:MFS general substrate transporter [Ophiobolus disseminans]|uniref:MFS general substrate transporter n=1 Tax=Ophiobolus disseminans TaxID=1469910 RepID=A0A6A6ZGS8_9PLEO|nr:MFS general substrate transporter [Ophiobolus disseminans]